MKISVQPAHRGNYQAGRAAPIQYIVVHYTANRGDTAKNNASYFARTVTQTSAHYFVDREEIWQSVQDGDTAWHCGSGHPIHPECRNRNSIGVEMCDSVGGVPEAVRANTAAMVRELMDRYQIPPERVLRHFDVTGKRCPAPWVERPEEWETFKAMIKEGAMTQEQFDAMVEDYLARRAARPASGWALPYIQRAVEAGVMADVEGSITAPQGFATREELAAVADALLARSGGENTGG